MNMCRVLSRWLLHTVYSVCMYLDYRGVGDFFTDLDMIHVDDAHDYIMEVGRLRL